MRKKQYLIIILLLLVLAQCRKDEITNPAYAIGTVFGYEPGGMETTRKINYTFYVNGKQYDNEYPNRAGGKKWKIPAGNYNQGDQYMVQYNIGDPSCMTCSRMLFGYKVSDSADYKSYVNQFKTNPPQ